MNAAVGIQTAAPNSPKPPKPRKKHKRVDLESAKTIVYAALAKGHSQAEAARLAGVTAVTVGAWVKKARASGHDMSRERLLNMLSMRLEAESTAPQYVTPMASLLADLQGWKTKRDEKVQLKPMSVLFDQWKIEQERANPTQRFTDRTLSDVESNAIKPASSAPAEQAQTAQTDQAAADLKAPGDPPNRNVVGGVE